MWICKNCKEENEDNFDICWNCQRDKNGNIPIIVPEDELVSVRKYQSFSHLLTI